MSLCRISLQHHNSSADPLTPIRDGASIACSSRPPLSSCFMSNQKIQPKIYIMVSRLSCTVVSFVLH